MLERDAAQLAFVNLAQLSARASVGKTTVTRFLRKLGYASFPDFTRHMRMETLELLKASPIQDYTRDKHRQPDAPACACPVAPGASDALS